MACTIFYEFSSCPFFRLNLLVAVVMCTVIWVVSLPCSYNYIYHVFL